MHAGRRATALIPSTARLGALLEPLHRRRARHHLNGELVAVSERDAKPSQDFAVLTAPCSRAARRDGPAQVRRLRPLSRSRRRLRAGPCEDRDETSAGDVAGSRPYPRAGRMPAGDAGGARGDVARGFEGTVPRRRGSVPLPGRHSPSWIKQKARITAHAELYLFHQDDEGCWHALPGVRRSRRVDALAGARTAERIGQLVERLDSCVDADGSLREARIVPARDGRLVTRKDTRAQTLQPVLPAPARRQHVPPPSSRTPRSPCLLAAIRRPGDGEARLDRRLFACVIHE